jgi:hypothetical protein
MQASEREKEKAAEILLADAIASRDKAQERVDWLASIAADYKGHIGTNGATTPATAAAAAEPEGQEASYGSIKAAVRGVMSDARKMLQMREIEARFVALGMQTGAKSPRGSVQNAVKALVRDGAAKKVGRLHYRAIEPKEGTGGE